MCPVSSFPVIATDLRSSLILITSLISISLSDSDSKQSKIVSWGINIGTEVRGTQSVVYTSHMVDPKCCISHQMLVCSWDHRPGGPYRVNSKLWRWYKKGETRRGSACHLHLLYELDLKLRQQVSGRERVQVQGSGPGEGSGGRTLLKTRWMGQRTIWKDNSL